MYAILEKDQAEAIGNMHKKLVKFGRVVVELCERTDRQTDRQTDKQTITDILITVLLTLPNNYKKT